MDFKVMVAVDAGSFGAWEQKQVSMINLLKSLEVFRWLSLYVVAITFPIKRCIRNTALVFFYGMLCLHNNNIIACNHHTNNIHQTFCLFLFVHLSIYAAQFAPEETFLTAVKAIPGISEVETQTYTFMPVE